MERSFSLKKYLKIELTLFFAKNYKENAKTT